jgi:hypothetical protein
VSNPGVAGIHRHRVMDPVPLAGACVKGLQEPRRVEVVAGAHQHLVAHDNRCHRREVLLVEVGNLHVPVFLARAHIDRHQVVVRRFEQQRVVPDRSAPIADVQAAARLPEEVPQLATIAAVDGPDMIRRGGIENAVHLEHRAAHRGLAHREITLALATRGDIAAQVGADARGPGQRQVLHVGRRHLREPAVALAGVVTGIAGPVAGQWLLQRFGRQHRRGGRRLRERGARERDEGEACADQLHQRHARAFHFSPARYAVTSCMVLLLSFVHSAR